MHFELLSGDSLQNSDLESLEFTDDDITIGIQTQIDFILVSEPSITELPHYIKRQLHRCIQYEYLQNTFRNEPKSIFIFWH
ncbi:hypothetical protein SAGO17_0040 [Mimivirus AB-566-O17]|uniref:Uncharacterized protein n=1 Tax=Mimivirus AB-566-O17 TaxID=1988039 RepID=A0A1X9VNR4_9VIRU|nr:hypothetical protein SAGO17_0040 [Mimivirus AB-566-O17]